MAHIIDSFSGEYRFLSNFYPCQITYQGWSYPSVEHAYQAAKCKIDKEKAAVRAAPTPGRAKALGQKVQVRSDWETVKVGIMKELVALKFKDPELRKLLDETGDTKLIEGNTWGDKFWGVCEGHGKNVLGKILEWVRNNE